MISGSSDEELQDILIIGAGPSGLSAAVNAKARNMKTIIFDYREPVGKVRIYPKVTNYLGFPEVSGAELATQFDKHFSRTGIHFSKEKVLKALPMDGIFMVSTDKGNVYQSKTVLYSAGVAQTKLIPGEEQYLGRGVSYCVTCDGALFRGKDVVVAGYTAEGEEEANALAGFARQVTYVAAYKNVKFLDKSIKVIYANPVSVEGDSRVKSLKTDIAELKADGIFIVREVIPVGTILEGLIIEDGFIKAARDMTTSIDGVFAAGDCTGPPFQIAKAVGEGQVAALNAAKYINRNK